MIRVSLNDAFSCTVLIQGFHALPVCRDSHMPNGQGDPTISILGSSTVKYGVRYFPTELNMKCAQNTEFHTNEEFMPNWRRHQTFVFAVLSRARHLGLNQQCGWSILIFHSLKQISQKLLWSLNFANIAIHFIEWQHMCIIWRRRNGYHCWLFLVAVDVIRGNLQQMIELPLGMYCTGSRQWLFTQLYGKSIIRGPFSDFKRKNESDSWKYS